MSRNLTAAHEWQGCSRRDTMYKAEGHTQRWPSPPAVLPVTLGGQKTVEGGLGNLPAAFGVQGSPPHGAGTGRSLSLPTVPQMPRLYLTLPLGSPAARL